MPKVYLRESFSLVRELALTENLEHRVIWIEFIVENHRKTFLVRESLMSENQLRQKSEAQSLFA